ncbi:hypothetical protein Hanom_Chr08g00722671 [Helianthus anomalus]
MNVLETNSYVKNGRQMNSVMICVEGFDSVFSSLFFRNVFRLFDFTYGVLLEWLRSMFCWYRSGFDPQLQDNSRVYFEERSYQDPMFLEIKWFDFMIWFVFCLLILFCDGCYV